MYDKTKLKRDYVNNPLKKGEYPEVDDLKYLFIECCLSRKECAEICNCTQEKIKIACKKLNIHKTHEQRNELRKRTTLERYGKTNVSQLDEVKQKKEDTSMKHFGVRNVAQSEHSKKKSKETCIDRYGVDCYSKSEEFKERFEKYLQETYNETNVMRIEEFREKQKNTIRERYNCDNVQQNPEIHQKSLETRINKYGDTRMFGTPSFYEKARETWLKTLGVDNPAKSEVIQANLDLIRPQCIEKMMNTKRLKGNLNTSTEEEASIKLLLNKFPKLETQYKSEEYPFSCDCYIPELDLYIEFNYHWTHENMPFISSKKTCLNILEKWQKKAEKSDYYVNAIETWTLRDPLKRETAKKNNLNWLEFFTMKSFMEWYNNICEI